MPGGPQEVHSHTTAARIALGARRIGLPLRQPVGDLVPGRLARRKNVSERLHARITVETPGGHDGPIGRGDHARYRAAAMPAEVLPEVLRARQRIALHFALA